MKEFHPFRLDAADQSLWRHGQRVPLTPKAFSVLQYLVERAGRLVTQAELLDALWPSTFVQPEVLKSQILDVRNALGDRPKNPLYIETVPRRGYRFIARVSDVDGADHTSPAARAVAAPADPARIAVLPFVNMSADAENEYFSDGLTEEVINVLAGVSRLHVVARTSAFQFKGINKDIRAIASQLNVGTVLEGSVRRAGDQVRVTAQLIDVESGTHLFSKTYQREFKDVFALQDDVARAVVEEIAPASGTTPGERVPSSRRTNVDAYNAYLRGMYALANRFGDLPQCLECYREALSLDPTYVPAYAGMAHAYFMMAWFYLGEPDDVMKLSKLAAMKALELDPDSSQALVPLGVSECADWNWRSGESRFRRAIHLQPADAQAHTWFVFFCLLPQRRTAEAVAAMERAVTLDPLNPLFRAGLIYAYGMAGRYDDVMREYSMARSIAPQYGPSHVAAAIALESCGRIEESIPIYRVGCELTGRAILGIASLGHALAATGQREEAHAIVDELLAAPIRSEADIARVFCGLRQADETLHWLEVGVDRRCLFLLRGLNEPRFDWLKPHPRFQAVLARMGLQ